ncbi:MAG: YceI family protein [Bryobacteraceae bacterium]
MKTVARFASALAFLLLPGLVSGATYQIDASHSTAAFTVRHMMVTNVSGAFGKLAGTVEFDPANPSASKIDVTIEAASVDTRNPKRDEHLRSVDFFDVANHPTITFRSTKVERTGENRYRVTGNLTIRGVTKEVTLEVETTPEIQAQGTARFGASATTRINRKDFGVSWNRTLDTGGVVVSDEVRINIDVALIRKIAPPAKS